MKYNKSFEGEDFGKYLEYLETIRDKLPKQVFDFVSNPGRHDLSKQSLHDSWVKSIHYSDDFENGNADISIILSGEKEFELNFHRVSKYRILQETFDKDLITYEIGIEQNNDEDSLVFRAMFSGEEGEIEVYCGGMEIREK